MQNPTDPQTFQRGVYDWVAGEPRVDLDNRDSIIGWLVWNDHNGCYTDAECAIEGLEPLTLETARESLISAFENSTGESILLPVSIDYTPELGKRFVTVLEEWLTPEEFEEVRLRNDTRTPGVCASHDFCDANMAMDQAWRDVVSPDGPRIAISEEVYADPDTSDADIADLEAQIEADSLLWTRAWDWAIEHYLSHSPVAMAQEI